MRTVEEYFAEYAASHRTLGNEITHVIGIPLIAWAVIRLVSIPTIAVLGGQRIDAGLAMIGAGIAFYATLSLRLAIGAGVAGIILWGLGHGIGIPWWVALAMFVVGWIFQLVGHAVFEGARPSFTKNLIHLLIGPIWLLNLVLRAAPTGLETKTAN